MFGDTSRSGGASPRAADDSGWRRCPHQAAPSRQVPLGEVDRCKHRVRWRCERKAVDVDVLASARERVRVRHLDERIGAVILVDAVHADIAGCAHEQKTTLRIERGAAPVRSADLTRPLKRSPQGRWREQRTEPKLLHLLLRDRLDHRSQIVGIIERDTLIHERRRFGRKRLGRIRLLAGHIACRVHGPFDDRPDRLAGHAIEHVGKALLGHLGDRIDAPAVDGDRHQIGAVGLS